MPFTSTTNQYFPHHLAPLFFLFLSSLPQNLSPVQYGPSGRKAEISQIGHNLLQEVFAVCLEGEGP